MFERNKKNEIRFKIEKFSKFSKIIMNQIFKKFTLNFLNFFKENNCFIIIVK